MDAYSPDMSPFTSALRWLRHFISCVSF